MSESDFYSRVEGLLKDWWQEYLMSTVLPMHGPQLNIACAVLKPFTTHSKESDALDSKLYLLSAASDASVLTREGGLIDDLNAMLEFTLRTKQASSLSRTDLEQLLEPGDLAQGGALIHRDFPVATAGLGSRSNENVSRAVAEKVIALRAEAARNAIVAADQSPLNADARYLMLRWENGNPPVISDTSALDALRG